MSDVQTNLISPARPQARKLSKLLKDALLGAFRHRALDARSLPDDILCDIGLSPTDFSVEREINMANVNLRAGIIFPRPC